MAEETTQEMRSEETKEDNSRTFQEIEFLLDIPLEVTVELGRTRMLLKDVLRISEGSIVELGKEAGEPLEIMVNNRLIARGEAVVVNEKFGIKITEIVSPAERIRRLR